MVLQCSKLVYYKVSSEFQQQDSQSSYSFGKIQNVGERELSQEKVQCFIGERFHFSFSFYFLVSDIYIYIYSHFDNYLVKLFENYLFISSLPFKFTKHIFLIFYYTKSEKWLMTHRVLRSYIYKMTIILFCLTFWALLGSLIPAMCNRMSRAQCARAWVTMRPLEDW